MAASATSLGNGFAYDDVHLVERNDRVHDVARIPALFRESYWPPVPLGPEGRLYRPLTTSALAVQWSIGRGHPLVFHVTSVLLAALVALLVLALATRLLPLGPATLAASVFAVHPVHTEVVGNVVGQGELLAAVGSLVAALAVADAPHGGWSGRRYFWVGVGFALALLAKEHPLVLVVLAPAVLLATGGRAALWTEAAGKAFLLLASLAFGYLAVRSAVLGTVSGDLAHPLWRGTPASERVLTMLTLVPTWWRLMLWPATLKADYSPQEVELVRGLSSGVWLGGALLGGMVVAMLVGRRRPAIWLGLLWAMLMALPTANLLIPTGVVFAERTLYLPSVGVCLALGGVAELIGRRARGSPVLELGFGAACLLLLALGAVWSARRLPVWRDNRTLFEQTRRDAPRSYWAWRNAAGDLVLRGQEREAIALYHKSLGLFSRDPTVMDDLAGVERRLGRCDLAVPLLRRALAVDSTRHQTAARLVGCYVTLGAWDSARRVARERVSLGQAEFQSILAMVDSAARARQLSAPSPDR